MQPFPLLDRVSREVDAQWAYQRRLASYVGALPALRARGLGLLDRWLGRGRSEIALQPPSLLHPVRLRVNSSDLEAYHQVLIEDTYGCLGDLEPEVVVDCGANAGFASCWFASRFPRARVIAFEPFGDTADLCRRNLAPYGARAELHAKAIWSGKARLVLEARRGHEWGVQVREALPGEPGDVDAIGIADLGLPRIDLLKIDIEGSEEQVFGVGAEAWLPTVGAIAVELHGPARERAFQQALAGYDYDLGTAGDMTMLRNLRRR